MRLAGKVLLAWSRFSYEAVGFIFVSRSTRSLSFYMRLTARTSLVYIIPSLRRATAKQRICTDHCAVHITNLRGNESRRERAVALVLLTKSRHVLEQIVGTYQKRATLLRRSFESFVMKIALRFSVDEFGPPQHRLAKRRHNIWSRRGELKPNSRTKFFTSLRRCGI